MKLEAFHIHVVEAKNIAGMDKNGTSDAYIVVKNSFNSQSFKTKVQKKTENPKWDQKFTVLTSKAEGELFIKLMHKRSWPSKDEFMGEITISLKDFADGGEQDKWYKLLSEPSKKKKDPNTSGEIHLKLGFEVKGGKDRSDSEAKETVEKSTPDQKKKKEESKKKATGPAKIEDNYKMGKIIGRGAFSVVKEGIRKANNKKYAIKCISKKLIDKKELALLEREIDIMKKLQHPNIIQLMEVIDTPETLYLVLEFAPGGELFDAIVNKGQYSEEDAAHLVKQILEAIKYVHDHGIAHRDLKPENLLLGESTDGKDFVKIADFGLSKDFGEEQLQTSCGTPDYVAPEVLLGEPYDMSVDIWSIGVITYVLLCGFPPFYGEAQKELFENIMSGSYDFPDPEWTEVSQEAKDFIRHILVVDPTKRYTAEECLADPWILQNTTTKKQIKRLESFSVKKFKEYNAKYKEENKKQFQQDVTSDE